MPIKIQTLHCHVGPSTLNAYESSLLRWTSFHFIRQHWVFRSQYFGSVIDKRYDHAGDACEYLLCVFLANQNKSFKWLQDLMPNIFKNQKESRYQHSRALNILKAINNFMCGQLFFFCFFFSWIINSICWHFRITLDNCTLNSLLNHINKFIQMFSAHNVQIIAGKIEIDLPLIHWTVQWLLIAV